MAQISRPKAGLDLAFCGSIRDEIIDQADLALELIRFCKRIIRMNLWHDINWMRSAVMLLSI